MKVNSQKSQKGQESAQGSARARDGEVIETLSSKNKNAREWENEIERVCERKSTRGNERCRE